MALTHEERLTLIYAPFPRVYRHPGKSWAGVLTTDTTSPDAMRSRQGAWDDLVDDYTVLSWSPHPAVHNYKHYQGQHARKGTKP